MGLCHIFVPFVFLSLIRFLARVEGDGSILFLDSPSHRYLRSQTSDAVVGAESMFLPEVGAAVSVLLGFAPPATISAATSLKLNEVLMPNPFKKPRAVFMLEVQGAEGLTVDTAIFSSVHRTKVIPSSNKADIQVPDSEKISLVSLNELLPSDSYANFDENEVISFASWLGGSYVTDSSKPLNGELTVPLASGAVSNLHMSKKADRRFIASLMALIRNIRSAIKIHEDFSGKNPDPADLMTGIFDGIKVLREHYGCEGVAQQGIELLFSAMSKIFTSMQASYRGELVGVIFINDKPSADSETLLNVRFTSRPSSRFLVESAKSFNSTLARELLVRRTVAWVTGIVLLIATFIGIYFLLNMPLTKDSLLYSNAKLD